MDAHEDSSYHRNGGKMSTGGSVLPRPSSEAAHHIHHKIAWKAINIDAKHVIFRCDGVCKDDPKYNAHTLGDPRNPLTRFRSVESIDLSLPSFILDNNSVGPQPKREVSIFGLNDNINHAFLTDMCQKTGQVIEVFVYMHPRTKKHLGMAYVVFQEGGKAKSFVAKNNGTSVMGQTITCIIDPYAKEISRRYEEQAVEAAPIPHYLSRLDHNRLTEFRVVSSASTSEYKRIPTSSSPSTSAQQSSDIKASELVQKKPDEFEAAFFHDDDRQIHQQSVESALTRITHIENIVPANERSTVPSITGHFAQLTRSPSISSSSCSPLTTVQALHQTFCSHHFMFRQQTQAPFTYYHSIPPNPVSPVSNFPSISPSANVFSPLPPLPPIAGRIPFPAWSNVPPPPLRTPAADTWPMTKTIISTPVQLQVSSMRNPAPPTNFASTAYQAVPSTSSCEEVAPMDPAPSKESDEKNLKITIPSVQRGKRSVPASGKIKVRKRRRLRESISVSSVSGNSSSKSDDSELSEESFQDSCNTVKRKHRHRKKGIVEERKYYKRKGAGGTSDYYKEIIIRKNDNKRKCSHETKSNILQSPELVEEVESYQRIRKYKKRQETAERDEHFVEPDVDLPDLESVSSDEDQLSTEQQELKVQSAQFQPNKSKNHREITKHIHQQQSKHVDWRKKRVMEKRRRQRDHRSCGGRESSSLSGDEKGHRWSSSSSTTESETESDELNSFRNCKWTCRPPSNLHSSKSSRMVNLLDMFEAVTSSSEQSHGEETGTSGVAPQPKSSHVKNSLIKNESTQSLPTPSFITSPEKLSSDSPLPCVMQCTPPTESSRSSFERRLENLFRSSSVQPPIIETYEEKRSNDGSCTSVPTISAFDTPFLPSSTARNAVEPKGMPLSEAFLIEHSSGTVTVVKQPSDLNSAESCTNSQPQMANSVYRNVTSGSASFQIDPSSPVDTVRNEIREENNHLDKTVEGRCELVGDQEMQVGGGPIENEEQRELEEQILEKKRAARENYVHAVYVAVREDLKNVLLKDLMRKIESAAFEKLEQGWKGKEKAKIVEQDDDSWQSEAKSGAVDTSTLVVDRTSVPSLKPAVSSKDSLNEVVRQVTEQTRAEMSAAFGPDTAALLGTGLFFRGLGIARSMPSFKKKQMHLSPKRKQRSRSSSSRSLCSTYSHTRSNRTPESSQSCGRSESQNRSRSESSLAEERSSDDEDARSENGRSTTESESTCSTDRLSPTFWSGKHFGSGTFTPVDGSTSEENEEVEVDEEEEGEEEEQVGERGHVEKDFDEIRAISKLSARSGIEEKAILFVRTEIEGNIGYDGTDSSSSCTTTSHLIEQDKITEELQTKHGKVLDVANMEGYFNDHCYLPVELSEQLKKEFEESVLVCTVSEMIPSEYRETRKLGKPEETLLQHVQDKAAKVKKRCYRNELASLLPPPVDVERLAWEIGWKPAKHWEKRTPEEEKKIFWKFEKEGLDAEDLMFLEKAFHEMQNDGTATWNRKLYWVPPRKVPEVHLLDKPKKTGKNIYYYDDPELEGVIPHSSGCARTEGYYKLSHKEKRGILRRPDVFLTEINEKDDEKARYLVQSTREARSMNRRLLTSMGDTSSDIFKVNQLKFRKKLIKFARSRIHGWGLYALEAIAPDEMIVEYIGQKIRPTVADEREKRYERRGMGSSYLFRIDSDNVIDATQMGNLARFINHSCQPNCYAKIVVVDGEKRIVIYSKLAINKGDEITYDYKFPIEEDKIDCLCGAPGCRGSLN